MALGSPDLNPLDCHMLEKYHKLQPIHKTTDELKVALQTIWEEMAQEHMNKAVAIFTKCLSAYVAVAANGGHSEHLQSVSYTHLTLPTIYSV